MKIIKIDADRQVVSRWSGGTTTQLAIYPENALYAERDFLWRVSSAVVELPESDFTPLPDYDRILMILEGNLSLSHDGGEEYTLGALEQTAFDGASHTFSRGKVTDFNLMMRKGRSTGRVGAFILTNDKREYDLGNEFDNSLLYCFSGNAKVSVDGEDFYLEKGDALLAEKVGDGVTCCISGEATMVLAEMKEI